jgi:F0F1-type ATP synthase membrane subunit b/b'
MPATHTPNADLEQSLFRANLKETRLRHRAFLAFLLPVVIGAAWLVYSLVVVTHWEAESRAVAVREAEIAKRETDWKQAVADADERRATAENSVAGAQEKQKAAEERAADIAHRLVKSREEIGTLNLLLSEISSAKLKASKLGASELVETHLTEIRTALGRTIGRIEGEIDKGLPPAEQKTRVQLLITDDSQRSIAKALEPVIEAAGFDVIGVTRSTVKRAETGTEIRYFREPSDRGEATRLQELIQKQAGQGEARIARGSDPDQTTGARKFQVWIGKPPPVASGR